MKTIVSLLFTLGLMAASAQATLITDCATLVGHTDKDPFRGGGGDKYEDWALGVIQSQSLPSPAAPFSKVDTSNTMVMLTVSDAYVMLHWGNGGIGDMAYQLYDVSGCAPGAYEFPSPRPNGGGLSWVGRLNGSQHVPDGGTNGSQHVPDGGTTLVLMSLALCGLAPARKLLGK